MRYIVDSNNYVTAISFGNTMEYNDCVCVEYTGAVPSSWNSLEDWYLDEGNKLWRWQIIDGELVMDESAVAPEEEDWIGVSAGEPSYATLPDFNGYELTFNLPHGTKKLDSFIILPNADFITKDEAPVDICCLSVHSSVKENITEFIGAIFLGGGYRDVVERMRIENAFDLGEDFIKVNVRCNSPYSDGWCKFMGDVEYALYPFYRR